MNLRDLRYIVAVADLKHFGRAAELCHVSQPTLSAQVKKLETYLGVILFERTQRSVRVTEAGLEIVRRARQIVHESDELITAAQAVQNPYKGRLRIGSIPTIGPYLFPRIVTQIRQHYPDLDLELHEQQTAQLDNRLTNGDLDVAILALPHEGGQFHHHVLYEERFVAAVPHDHPQAEEQEISLSALRADRLLLLEEGHCLRDQALEVCTRMHLSEHGDFRATSFETLRSMVAAGAGVTLLPAMAVEGRQDNALRYLDLKRPAAGRTVGMIWRQTSAREPVLKALAQTIIDTVGSKL